MDSRTERFQKELNDWLDAIEQDTEETRLEDDECDNGESTGAK
jgi:hypothetical protein